MPEQNKHDQPNEMNAALAKALQKRIIVNGQEMTIYGSQLSHKRVAELAGIPYLESLTVTISYPDGRGRILTHEQHANVVEGMIINAAHTGNA